jgi:hypothetical protein
MRRCTEREDSHVKTKGEIGVRLPPAQECLERLGEAKMNSFPRAFGESVTLVTS